MRTSPFAFVPLALALLAAPGLAFAQPSEADRAEARRQFQSGVQQFQQRSFAPALEAFQSAYRIAPHPSVRKNMAFCLQELGRDGEALEQFELFLSEAQNVPTAERRTIDQRIRTLRARLSDVTVSVTPADALSLVVTVDERVVSTARPVRLGAGHHTVRVAATGYATITREIDTVAGQAQTLTLALEREAPPPPPPPPPTPLPPPTDPVGTPLTPPGDSAGPGPLASTGEDVAPPSSNRVLTPEAPRGRSPTLFYAVAGVTGAAAIAWGVCGVLALSRNGDFEDAVAAVSQRPASDPEVPGLIARGQELSASANRFALFSDVAMGVTLAGAVAASVIFFKTDFGGRAVSVTAAPTAHGGTLGLSGSF